MPHSQRMLCHLVLTIPFFVAGCGSNTESDSVAQPSADSREDAGDASLVPASDNVSPPEDPPPLDDVATKEPEGEPSNSAPIDPELEKLIATAQELVNTPDTWLSEKTTVDGIAELTLDESKEKPACRHIEIRGDGTIVFREWVTERGFANDMYSDRRYLETRANLRDLDPDEIDVVDVLNWVRVNARSYDTEIFTRGVHFHFEENAKSQDRKTINVVPVTFDSSTDPEPLVKAMQDLAAYFAPDQDR